MPGRWLLVFSQQLPGIGDGCFGSLNEGSEAGVVVADQTPQDSKNHQAQDAVAAEHMIVHDIETAHQARRKRHADQDQQRPMKDSGGQIPDKTPFHFGAALLTD